SMSGPSSPHRSSAASSMRLTGQASPRCSCSPPPWLSRSRRSTSSRALDRQTATCCPSNRHNRTLWPPDQGRTEHGQDDFRRSNRSHRDRSRPKERSTKSQRAEKLTPSCPRPKEPVPDHPRPKKTPPKGPRAKNRSSGRLRIVSTTRVRQRSCPLP